LGKPKTNIQKFVESARQEVISAIVLSIVFALVMGLILYLWVSKPLKLLVEYADKVIRGERANPPLNGGQEIQQVAQSMADMRKALEDKQYVERYVQTLTHEIKSPLTGIMAAAELLGNELPEEKRQHFSGNILLETARLNDFADRLLQLAAVEKLDQLVVKEVVDLDQIVKSLIASLKPVLTNKSLLIDYRGDSSLKVNGDAFLLKQAIENLLRNAIDFSLEGSIIIIAFATHDNVCEISVIDEGEGIPDFATPHIFERFYSLPRPSGKKSTGLGLNFVREVAELHQGEVCLKNNPTAAGAEAKLYINHTVSS